MRKRSLRHQAGDTIVEVLLSVIVVGLAIGLGYGVASRSLKTNRRAQERVEAVKQAEGQIERLKLKATNDDGSGSDSIFRSTPFCMAAVGANANEPVPIDSEPPADLNSDPLNSADYADGACVANNLYHLSITPQTPAAGVTQFRVMARWNSFGGQTKEEVVITYRIYEEEST